MIMLFALAAPLFTLPLSAIAVSAELGLSGLTTNSGPHGFTEILFAYTSCFANNGQSFASLSANSPFYSLTTALAMMAGRLRWRFPHWDSQPILRDRELRLLRPEPFRHIPFCSGCSVPL
jgi:K+-transporting ATPase ATPase A chain